MVILRNICFLVAPTILANYKLATVPSKCYAYIVFYPQSRAACPQIVEIGVPSRCGWGGLPSYNWVCLTYTQVRNVFGESHASCKLQTTFVDFKKWEGALKQLQKTNFFVSTRPTFPEAVKCNCHSCPILPSFLYIFYILLNFFSYWIWNISHWTLNNTTNNQYNSWRTL